MPMTLAQRRWVSANRSHVNAVRRAWRKRNLDKERLYRQRAKERHPDRAASATSASRAKDPARALYNQAKARARKCGIPFVLDRADIVVPKTCPILGIPFGPNTGRGVGPWADSPSLDRIIPAHGYVKGNIQVISRRANTMKSDASPAELLAFANWVHSKYGSEYS